MTAFLMPEPTIRAEQLTKHYRNLAAVQDLNLRVYPGDIYGLLGPNGAGKTTTMLMVLGILPPTAGKITLFGGLSPADFESKRRIGVVPENQYFYEDMSAREFLELFAEIYQVRAVKSRIAEMLEKVQLSEWVDTRIKAYSHGMKQRLSIARALLHDPEILILDEPVQGLDPYGVRDVRKIISEQQQAGKTILISSHILSEVERSATRVGILRKGRLVAEGAMSELRSRLIAGAVIELKVRGPLGEITHGLENLECVSRVTGQGDTLKIETDRSEESLAVISQCVSSVGGVVLGMKANEMSLEEAFFSITEGNAMATVEEQA